MAGVSRRSTASRAATALCLSAIAALAFFSQPGRVVADTKFDVVADPGRFLSRAWHAWDPFVSLGSIPNQTVGYLFPMGSFHWLGMHAGLSPWVVQRLWLIAVLSMGYLGGERLLRRLSIGSNGSRHLAALGFAVSPWALGVVPTSAFLLPAAMTPWIVLPLLDARPSWRRLAASGLAVMALGGVNAAGAISALAVAVIVVLHRTDRWKVMLRWGAVVIAATAWWIVPLLILGRYGVDFTAFTEKADVTASTTSVGEALAGTSYWLARLQRGTGPFYPAGWMMAEDLVPRILVGIATMVGLIGLVQRDLRWARLWRRLAIVGVVLVSASFAGTSGGGMSGAVQALLDGALSPFRNTSKFDPLIRLPLMVGVAHILPMAFAFVRRACRPRALAGIAAVALGGSVVAAGWYPLLRGGVYQRGGFTALPADVTETASWLREHATGATLIAPATDFSEYSWGRPLDDPFTALGVRTLARNIAPLGPHGLTRLHDALTARLDNGEVIDGLPILLDSVGVSHVVVQSTLDRKRTGAPPPGRTIETLQASGLTVVRESATLVVFEVPGADAGPRSVPVDSLTEVVGGPDAIVPLAGTPLARSTKVLRDDPGAGLVAPAAFAVADSLRYRRETFGQVRGGRGLVVRPNDDSDGEPVQRVEPRWGSHFTVYERAEPGARPLRLPAPSGRVDVVVLDRLTDRIGTIEGPPQEPHLDRKVEFPTTTVLTVTGRVSAALDGHRSCGEGPSLAIDGMAVETRFTTPTAFEVCGDVELVRGVHRIVARDGAVASIVMVASTIATRRLSDGPALSGWTSDGISSSLTIAGGPAAVIVLPHSFNEGFSAQVNGTTLAPLRVAGWQQAYLVPAGSGGRIVESFDPDRLQRIALLLSLIGGGIVLSVAAAWRRARVAPTLMQLAAEGRTHADGWRFAAALGIAAVAVWLIGGWMVLSLVPLVVVPERRTVAAVLAPAAFALSTLARVLELDYAVINVTAVAVFAALVVVAVHDECSTDLVTSAGGR